MKIWNNIGPNAEPWGTSDNTDAGSELTHTKKKKKKKNPKKQTNLIFVQIAKQSSTGGYYYGYNNTPVFTAVVFEAPCQNIGKFHNNKVYLLVTSIMGVM